MLDGTGDCAIEEAQDSAGDGMAKGMQDNATDDPLNAATNKACNGPGDVKVKGAGDERDDVVNKYPVSVV